MSLIPPRALARKAGRAALYLVAFFIIAALVNWFQSPKAPAGQIRELELTTLAGERSTLQTAAGKKTIIYFFAPWCGVCKISMDALNMFAGKDDMRAIAVGFDYDNLAELKPFQEKMRAPVFAGGRELQSRFQIDRYPTVYILDGEGNITSTMVGYTSRLGIWLRTKI